MDRGSRVPLSIVDLAGGAIVMVCLLVAAWLVASRADGARSETARLARLVQTAQRDLTALRAARDRQRAVLADRRAELDQSGHLPEHTSVEAYSRTLSNLAFDHQLRVVRQHPVSPRQYPGLIEQRFVYEMTGSMPNLVRFFEAVERTDFWADISYLEIGSARGMAGQAPDDRLATLTMSLFSALPSETSTNDG